MAKYAMRLFVGRTRCWAGDGKYMYPTRVYVYVRHKRIPTYIYNFRNDEVEMSIKHKQTQTHRVVAEDIWNG